MVTLGFFVIANILALAMYAFKDDQDTVLILAGAFCCILMFITAEYLCGVCI